MVEGFKIRVAAAMALAPYAFAVPAILKVGLTE
jgi:hypothetical protein